MHPVRRGTPYVPARGEWTMPQTFNVGSRSLFVSITAWVFIVLGVMVSALALVQGASIASLLPGLALSFGSKPLQGFVGLLAAKMPWVTGVTVALSAATLAAAIGLLLRLEWARRAFIVLVVLAIVANLVGVWLQQELLQGLIDQTLSRTPLPREAAGLFGGFATAARIAALTLSVATCLLLGWVIQRLNTPSVRQEFA
jgi:hypothetical protein